MNIIKRILRVIVRTAIYLYCKVVYRLKVIGKENIPKEGPVIYCGNHRSYLDPPLIVVTAGRHVRFMAKEELTKNKFLKFLGYVFDAMIEKYKIKLELIKYIEQIVNYHYNLNDKGHGVEHAKYVINRSFEFAYQVESINLEMVYVIAAYHDVAHHIDAKNHETISAKMLMEDKKLKDFFTDEQIKIMSEAVEDHRSSMETEPRSIYGKIVSSADRNTSVEVTLKRCYSYNRRHFSELKESEIIEECRKFLLKKFGINGYARSKMFFDDKEYKKYLDDITDLALDSDKFAVEIKKVNEIY